jgi:hypothetical protein
MKIIMPKPDYSKMSINAKLIFKCQATQTSNRCPQTRDGFGYCEVCALRNEHYYKKWQRQLSESKVIKWPIPDKERFFVLPRTFVNFMPERWKRRFLKLINEFAIATEQGQDNPFKYRVSVAKNGQYVKMPEILKGG